MLQALRKSAIESIKDIGRVDLNSFVYISHPSLEVNAIMQAVQLLLAGNFDKIEMDPSTNQIASNDWKSIRKMVIRYPHDFILACLVIFDKMEENTCMEDRVAEAAKLMESELWNHEKAMWVSLSEKLAVWAENVVKYWKHKHSMALIG